MADRTIVGGVDTWVGDVDQSANHNGSNNCLVQAGANTSYMLLFLPASAPVKAGATVLEATLKLHLKYASAGALTFRAAPLSADWRAGKATWDNRPEVTGTGGVTAEVTGADADTVVAFDVATQLQRVADGDKWFGWRISLDTTGQLATIFSSEAGAEWRQPKLEIRWSNAPVPPTDLAPAGGRYISISAPLLRYTYLDFGGNEELTAHQIKVERLDDFGEPTGNVWDSGELPASDPEFDLSTAVGFTPLSNGEAVRWRVRVRDGAGLLSEWSDWASFERLVKGTLTIDSPAAAPDDYVQEVTPPILWTHAGPWAQQAWQLIVQQQSGIGGDWFELYNTGKRSGADDAWTLPKGVLTRANWSSNPDPDGGDWEVRTHYRLTVRTWDGQGRERTPGDPAYYQARREFDVREGATAPVTNLQADQARPYPWTELTWTRDTAPDKFIIARGGNIIDVVTADEVSVGGTSYRFVDKYAQPNRWHVWTVLPVVNGVMAAVEHATTGANVDVHGIWLTNPERDNSAAVLIQGEDGPPDYEFTNEDQGETYQFVRSSRQIRVTSALMGYSGTVSGVLAEQPIGRLADVSAREWTERMYAFKQEPTQRLLLTLSDMTIPVVIFNVSVAPTHWIDRRTVSFEWIEDRIPSYVDA